MEMVNYQKFIGTWGLRIFLKNGTLHRFRGFKEGVSNIIFKFFLFNILYILYNIIIYLLKQNLFLGSRKNCKILYSKL